MLRSFNLSRGVRAILAMAMLGCVGQAPRAAIRNGAEHLAIVGVTVADGSTAEPRRNWTVVVRDERIVAAGPAAQVEVPGGARRVDGRGKYLVPGMWDMHVHLDGKDVEWLGLLVAHGVTTVRELGTLRAAEADSMRRIAIARGFPAPAIITAGFMVETSSSLAFIGRIAAALGSGPHPTPNWSRGHVVLRSPEDARSIADSVKRHGGTLLKFIDPGQRDAYFALAAAARDAGLTLVGHAPQALALVTPMEALEAGQRSFEHGVGFARWIDTMAASTKADLAGHMARRRAAYVPTLIALGHQAIPTERFSALINDSLGNLDPRNAWISSSERAQWAARLQIVRPTPQSMQSLRDWEQLLIREMRALRDLHRLGAPILVGSDLGIYLTYPGGSFHDELDRVVGETGMTPFEALRAATLLPAQWAGEGDSAGLVRRGYRADLVLLNADPLADHANLASVRAVVIRGQLMDSAAVSVMRAWRSQ